MSSEHVILSHQDTPMRILIWPASEFMAVVAPVLLLLMMGHPIVALLLSGLVLWGIRVFKQSFGLGMLEGVLYRYFIHCRSKYRVTPPSYRREFIG